MSCLAEVYSIDDLPAVPLDAAAALQENHLQPIRDMLSGDAAALVVVLPHASKDHDDWRRAIARDLGRAFAPKRVNVIARGSDQATGQLIEYLGGAPGITGQYLPAHD